MSAARPGASAAALIFLALLAAPLAAQEPPAAAAAELREMTLEELLEVRVESASRSSETLAEAPATVILLTRAEIAERGYLELSEILDDLPGMDVVRPYGDTWFKNYWRGYRNTVGEPFLVMVDGLVFNHLYFATADVLAAIPLASVERVEVVYGPASAVYGANASMGVLHVITAPPRGRGSSGTVLVAAGSSRARLADAAYVWEKDGLRLRFAGRFDDGELAADGERYEYTRMRYARDPALWGGFASNPQTGGAESQRRHRAFDLRADMGEVELGVTYYRMDSGYGLEYARDRAQPAAVWMRPEWSLFARNRHDFSERARLTSLLRYRESGVEPESYFVQSYPGTAADPRQRADFSYWSAHASSWSVAEDLELSVSSRLALVVGARYEHKDLQKAYETAYGPALPAAAIDDAAYPLPLQPTAGGNAANRTDAREEGIYALARWRPAEGQIVHLGARWDHDSVYGRATTLRAGYVGRWGHWGVKALYGQAFQEPNQRLLYGGWNGSGSDPTLDPERSATMELGVSHTMPRLSQLLSLWHVRNEDTFVNTAERALNLGERTITGFDWHLQTRLAQPWGGNATAWAYASRIVDSDEKKLDSAGHETGEGEIGDLAKSAVRVGLTARAGEHFSGTLRGRWIGGRRTVESNPLRSVGDYATLDAFARWQGFFARGIGLSLRVTNLTDTAYDHPGIRDADAGATPGEFGADGIWRGSAGYFSSVLPQPGREILLTLHLSL